MANPYPVVIIPGYYGTLLVDRAANNRTVWLTLNTFFKSGEVLDAINLETGDPDRIVSGGILEEVTILGNWAPNVYKDLRLFFGTIGFRPEDVISFGVDWRRTLEFNVDQLHAKILPFGKVNIVAHSHGGLVAREYLRKHGGELVNSLITLGTPHKGMLKTFQAIYEGSDVFKFSKSHVMKTARTFPSAYELLPSDPADGLFRWANRNADPFANDAWLPDNAMRPKLTAAAGVVTNLPKNLPVRSAFIYGTHLDTPAYATGAPGRKLKFPEQPVGDGTVPAVSASGAGLTGSTGQIERYAIPYGVHTQLFEYEPAKRIMKNILFDRPMPHFSYGFDTTFVRRGTPVNVAVDVRGPRGEVLDDAEVTITINRRTTQLVRDNAAGDYVAQVALPDTRQHVEYKITARSASLATPFTDVGTLFTLNG